MKTILYYSKKVFLLVFCLLNFYPSNLFSQFTVDVNTVALWRFDEANGDTIYDATANHNDGLVSGNVPIVPGLFGNARRFSGDNNYINFGNSPSLQLTNMFSIEAFVKVDTLPSGWGYIAGKYDGSTGDVTSNFQLSITQEGKVEWKVGANTTTLRSNNTIPLSSWFLITATYDGTLSDSSMKIYLNGILDTAIDRTGLAPANSFPVVIGERKVPPDGNCSSCYHNGTTIDEVRISDIARVPDPIAPIPVEIIAFSAFILDGNITLNWTTATETNNMGFEIYRSTDDNHFAKIGFVKGAGTKTDYTVYEFIDRNLENELYYYYRLSQLDYDGSIHNYPSIKVALLSPMEFFLSSNFPNPFNPNTKIQYGIPKKEIVSLKIYDILGREVAVLVNEEKQAGYYSADFNAGNLSSGVYIYKLQAGDFIESKKMILAK